MQHAETPTRPSWHSRLEEGLLVAILVAMTLVSFGQVVARYGFNYSFTWALELVTNLFAALIFIGISYGIRTRAHLGVDILVSRLPARGARACAIVATLLCLVYAGIVLVGGFNYVAKMHEVGVMSEDLPIAQWIPRLVLPIGIALAFVRFLQALVEILRGERTRLLGDEAEDALHLELGEDGPRAGGDRA